MQRLLMRRGVHLGSKAWNAAAAAVEVQKTVRRIVPMLRGVYAHAVVTDATKEKSTAPERRRRQGRRCRRGGHRCQRYGKRSERRQLLRLRLHRSASKPAQLSRPWNITWSCVRRH